MDLTGDATFDFIKSMPQDASFIGLCAKLMFNLNKKDHFSGDHSFMASVYISCVAKQYALENPKVVKNFMSYTLRTTNFPLRTEEISKNNKLRLDIFLFFCEHAAMLHDIGKLDISDKILRKKGPLNKKERTEMNKHPSYGIDEIKRTENDKHQEYSSHFAVMKPAIECHHEWYNGDGYPEKKMERQIPLIARLITPIDWLEALTNQRPYREPMTFNRAFNYLVQQQKKYEYFDPFIFKAFCDSKESLYSLSCNFNKGKKKNC